MSLICKILLSRSKCINRSFKIIGPCGSLNNDYSTNARLTENDVEEVKIPVPWGHIAGKWWGKKDESPFIAIHGWQDNASSFDALVPLLNVSSFLAIDLPGHGLSSHYPQGKVYNFLEYMCVIKRVADHYKWSSYSLCGHSFGSALAYVHSSLYPDEVKCFVSLECARTSMLMLCTDLPGSLANGINDILSIEEKVGNSLPPAYKLSDMVQMSFKGSMGSIDSLESAMILLQRSVLKADSKVAPQSKKEAKSSRFILEDLAKVNVTDEKSQIHLTGMDKEKSKAWDAIKSKTQSLEANENLYFFTRDPKIKIFGFGLFNEELLTECAKHITCPVLAVQAERGFIKGPYKAPYEKTNNILKEHSKYFESHSVKGSHHSHLNTPQNVAPVFNAFLKKVVH